MLVRKLALNTVATKLFLQVHNESPALKTTAASVNQGVLLERLTSGPTGSAACQA